MRFVENFGGEHVLHVEYGDGLVAVTAEPDLAASGDQVHIAIDFARAHLISRLDESVVPFEHAGRSA